MMTRIQAVFIELTLLFVASFSQHLLRFGKRDLSLANALFNVFVQALECSRVIAAITGAANAILTFIL